MIGRALGSGTSSGRRLLPVTAHIPRTALLLASLWSLAPGSDAQAYLDPGSGSLVFQALAAGLVTVVVVLRTKIRRALRVFRRGGEEPATRPSGATPGRDREP